MDELLDHQVLLLIHLFIFCCCGLVVQATNQIIVLLLVCTAALLLLPLKWLVLISFLNLFTSLMPARLETTARFNRRLSEWWYSIPVVPVRFLKPGEVENIRQ